MLISHRYRFIYTKTAKTAGTSVESFFERFCMPEGEWTQSHARDEYETSSGVIGFRGANRPKDAKWWNHMPAVCIKKLIGQDIWANYYKFCVVRNPFDKCISAFCHIGKDHGLQDPSLSSEQQRFFDYIQKAAVIDRDKYLREGEFCIDDFIRFEDLEAGIERVMKEFSRFRPRVCWLVQDITGGMLMHLASVR